MLIYQKKNSNVITLLKILSYYTNSKKKNTKKDLSQVGSQHAASLIEKDVAIIMQLLLLLLLFKTQ
jgi:hypothetical protein